MVYFKFLIAFFFCCTCFLKLDLSTQYIPVLLHTKAQGFPLAALTMVPGYFRKKRKENIT